MNLPDASTDNKEAIINKLTVYYSAGYWLILWCMSIVFHVALSWFFFSYNNFNDFKTVFPNYYLPAFIAIKCFPFIGLFLFLFLNLRLLWKHKTDSLKVYFTYLFFGKEYLYYLFFGAIGIFLICLNIDGSNLPYNLTLIFFLIFILLQLNFNIHTNTRVQLFSLIIIGLVLRLIYYFSIGDYDMNEDSMARIAQIYKWEIYGGLPGELNWPGGHHILIWTLAKIFNTSYEVAGRILSLLCSVLLIPVAYKFFEKLFDKDTAYLSLLFYALNPFFIRFSTIQMTEVSFLFFVILSLFAAYNYFENKKNKFLLLSALCMNMASLLRFEAWIIIPLFAAVYFFSFRNFKKSAVWAMLSAVSAVLFSWISYYHTGDPISGVTASDVEVRAELINARFFDFFFKLIWVTWVPLLFIPLMFLGLVYAIRNNKHRYVALGILLLSSYYIFKMAGQTLMPFWRYLFFVVFFTLPFLFYFLQRFISFKRVLILFILYYCIKTSGDISNVINSYQPPSKGFFESAIFYKTNYLNDNEAKLILSMNPYSQMVVWKAYSGIYHEKPVFRRLFAGAKTFVEQEDFTIANTRKKITEENYRYIIIQKGYEMDSILNDKAVVNYLRDRKVKTHHFEEMTIIKID